MQAQARHRRVKAIFYDAWLRPPSERGDYLATVCADEQDLRLEVESLLRYHQPLLADSTRGFRPPPVGRAPRTFRRGALVAGRYRIERLIGKGGMGEVYAAEDRMLGVHVALKVLRQVDDLRRRQMIVEVRLARQITHPGVCRMYDMGEHAGTPFLTMELIEGEDLAKRLQRSGPLPSDEVAALGERICEALAAAHAAGVLHRDLKPSNILVDRHGGVHLTDFGIASSREVGTASEQSSAGRTFGTPAYMAPEECGAAGVVTEKTDLYSLGLVLYELVTGAPPFDAPDPAVVMELHRTATPQPPSRRVAEVDPHLERAILALLAKDTEQRPESALAVGRELAASRHRRPPTEAPVVEEGERRSVTLMLCSLAALGGRDLEVSGGTVRLFQSRCAALVLLHGGRVVRHLDRGLLAQFGYPELGEQASESAVRAGLAIVGEVRAGALEPELSGKVEPAVAIDVRSLVLRGGRRHPRIRSQSSVQRLEEVTVPGSLVVSDAVLTSLHGAYEIAPAEGRASVAPTPREGAPRRKASSARAPSPARAHWIVGHRRRGAANPVPARLTPFIGRSETLAFLARCWRQARAGRGQAVHLTGEGGLGKSRLAAEIARQVGEEAIHLETSCSSFYRASVLHPFLELLASKFDLDDSDGGPTRVMKLELGLASIKAGARLLPVFAAWLGRPVEGPGPVVGTGGPREHDRRLIIRALGEWILALSEERPVLLTCEDLHWADPTTLEALDHLAGEVRTGSVMMLLTSRPEFRPSWNGGRVTTLALQPLEDTEARALIEGTGATLDLTDRVARTIVARAEGNPLFLEALVKERAEAPAAAARRREAADTPPSALESLLAARLDRLGAQKRVAQIAAVCGRTFGYPLLEAAAVSDRPLAAIELEASVDRLLDDEILFQRGTRPDAVLTFTHALLREVAHHSLPRQQRRDLHAAVARALPGLEPGVAASRPEVVAAHWSEGGNRREALEWWRRAGALALGRSANREAASHYGQAIAALGAVAKGAAKRSLEVELWTLLSVALTGCDGPASPAVARCMRRVSALCPHLEDDRELARAWFLLCRYHLVLGDRSRTLDFAIRLQTICDRIDDDYLKACARIQKGNILAVSGRLAEADRAHAEGLTLYAAGGATRAWSLAVDPQVMAETVQALVASLRGLVRASRAALERAMAAADRLDHPLSRVYPRTYGLAVGLLNGDYVETADLAREGIVMAESIDASAHLGFARAFAACAAVGAGVETGGVARMEEGLAAFDATGQRTLRPVVLLFLATALERQRGSQAALATLDQALEHARHRLDSYLLPEIQRRRGEALAQLDRADEAERAVREGVRVARRMGAFRLEARAAASFARLQTARGRHAEARQTLLAVRRRLPSDFDTQEGLGLVPRP